MNLVPARDLDPRQLEQVQAIYEDAFIAELRSDFDNLLADDLHALLDGTVPVGFAVLRDLGPTPWVYLRYLATGHRGHGLGSTLWAHLLQAMTATGHTRIIWDVEDPDEPGTDVTEAHLRTRRIGFYTRLNAQLLPVRGYQMPLETDNHPMLLMASGLGPDPGPAMIGDELRAVVTTVYRYRYGLDETDPLVQDTLRASGLGPAT